MQEPTTEIRAGETIRLVGRMAVYASQTQASEGIPGQWKAFLADGTPEVQEATMVIGASPDVPDGRIHYLCGIPVAGNDTVDGLDELTLPGGEYVVFTVADMAEVRPTWGWFFTEWLPKSGRKERSAPEYERFHRLPASTELSAPVELWIPLEPASHD